MFQPHSASAYHLAHHPPTTPTADLRIGPRPPTTTAKVRKFPKFQKRPPTKTTAISLFRYIALLLAQREFNGEEETTKTSIKMARLSRCVLLLVGLISATPQCAADLHEQIRLGAIPASLEPGAKWDA